MFWQRHPALLCGIFAYLGGFMALSPSWHLLIPLPFFLVQLCNKKAVSSLLIALSISCAVYFFTSYSVHLPELQEEMVTGTARIEITDLSQAIRFGTPYWKLKAKIHTLADVKNVLCTATWKDFYSKPDPRFLYEVKGTLKRMGGTHFVFTQSRGAVWKKVDKTFLSSFSLVDTRLLSKMHLKTYLRGHLPPGDARTFLEGLLMGEFHDQILADSLQRAGLSHIIVVSGFHFSLIAAFFGLILRFFFSWKLSVFVLFMVTTGYFFFIGMTPSVARAWISVSILLLGKLLQREATGLNSLGIGLLALVIYEPLFAPHIGFQLSFLATFAILLFYPVIDHYFTQIFPKRSASSVLHLTLHNQFGHLVFVFFRKSWALLFAVHVVTLPLILYLFHTFPLISIFYNLFFPFLTAIAMSFLCLACLLFWFPMLSQAMFYLSHSITDGALFFVTHAPRGFEKNIIVESVPEWLVVTYLSLCIYVGVLLYERKHNELSTEPLFAYA